MFKELFAKSFIGLVLLFCFTAHAADEGSNCKASAAPAKSSESKAEKKKAFELPKEKFVDTKLTARAEVKTLKDLVDLEDNLVVKHPFLAMNAAQRILAIVNKAGYTEKNLYGSGKTYVSNFFHKPSVWNGFKMVGGQEAGTSQFVSQLKRAVANDSNVISFVGPHGSGKSAILSVISGGLKAATEIGGNETAYFTFSWKNLDRIPALRSASGVESVV